MENFFRMLELVFERFSRIWLYPDKIFNFFQISKNTNECINYVRNFTENVSKSGKILNNFVCHVLTFFYSNYLRQYEREEKL